MSTSLQDFGDGRTGGYLGIAGALRAEILEGALAPSSQLPPIGELAQRHGTTPITVRRALRQLEEEGLVRVEHGVGSFVADWTRGLDLLPSFSAAMAAGSAAVETRVLRRDTNVRCAAAAAALRTPEDAPLVMLARVRSLQGAPLAYQRSYLPMSLYDTVLDYTPERSLYEVLRASHGLIAVAADETLDAVVLNNEAAQALAVPDGTPGWSSLRATFDVRGTPLVFDEAYFPASRVRLHVRRRANTASLEYRLIND